LPEAIARIPGKSTQLTMAESFSGEIINL